MLSGGADACVTPGMIFGFSRMRVVSTAYNDAPAQASRPFDAAATASCSARARGCWCSSAKIARARAARAIYASIDGYALDLRRLPPRADGARRRGDRPRDAARRSSAPGRALEEIGYVNYHGTSTVLNDAVESRCVRRGVRRARRPARRVVDEVDDRPPAGRERRRRRRDGGARAVARLPAADHQPARSRSGVRPRLHPEPGPRRRRSRPRSATASASDRRTARSSSARRLDDARWSTSLIVGRGPGRRRVARDPCCARAGARVRLLDRARFPRDKLCGDTLNPGTLAHPAPARRCGARRGGGLPIEGMIVTGERRRRVAGPYPRRPARRARFCGAISTGCSLQQARRRRRAVRAGRRGARRRSSRPTARAASPASSCTDRGARARTCARASTIAADGRRSTLAFALGLARHPRASAPLGRSAPTSSGVGRARRAFGEMHVRRGRYIGVAPVPGGPHERLPGRDRRSRPTRRFAIRAALLDDELARDPRLARSLRGRAARSRAPVVLGPLAVDADRRGDRRAAARRRRRAASSIR